MREASGGQGRSAALFLLLWIAANLVGGFIVAFLEGHGFQFMATLILTGAIVGSLQWWVLRRQIRLPWWPLASAIGWIVASLGMTLIQGVYQPLVDGLWNQFGLWEVFWLRLVTAPIPILGMAMAQSFLIGQHGGSMGLWLLASVVGGAVQGMVDVALCAALCPALPSALVGLVYGLGWAAYGVMTGLAWLRILQHRKGAEESV